MARPTTPTLLSELRNAPSSASRLKILKQLKNEIIGHEQKKQYWVRSGLLKHLVEVLDSHHAQGDKTTQKGDDGDGDERGPSPEGEDAQLQAIIIAGSLAQGQRSPMLHISMNAT